jgi:plasmid stabilization system protein ParE
MTIRYSPSARDELRQLKAYLTAQFGAVVAAKSAAKIISDISTLKQHRLLAGDLSDKVGRETPYL